MPKLRKPRLIPGWQRAYRYISVQVSGLASLALIGWVALPPDQQQLLLDKVGLNGPAYAALAAFVVTVLGRLVSQAPPEPPPPPDTETKE